MIALAKGRGGAVHKGDLIGRSEKHCWYCDTVKSADQFGPNAQKGDLLSTECRDCARLRARQRYQRRRHVIREQALNKQYGITGNDYDRLLAEGNGACWICRSSCSTGKRLAVDHDHQTGKVRGLLCTRCNQGIGLFADEISRLESAIAYLKRAAA